MIKQRSIIDLLTSYQPSSEEKLAKKEMLFFAKSMPNCFERSCETGHFTASSWLISKDGTKALLLHHRKLDLWVQPGGHADGNPNLLDVAICEAKEESGIDDISPLSEEVFDLDIHKIPARGSEKEHLHYDVRFLLQITSDQEPILNHESKGFFWTSKTTPPQTNSRSILRMFEKWQQLDLQ